VFIIERGGNVVRNKIRVEQNNVKILKAICLSPILANLVGMKKCSRNGDNVNENN
jgi:hypothetical protein